MRLKHVLVATFIILSAIPLFLSIQYLITHASEQYREQTKSKLAALSLVAKKRVLAVIDRVEDNTALVASRTQMRLSLDAWSQSGEERHLQKINRILNDAKANMTRLRTIAVYGLDGKLVTSTAGPVAPAAALMRFPEGQDHIYLHQNGELTLTSVSPLLLDNVTIGYIKVDYSADFLLDMVYDRIGLGVTGEWLFAVRSEAGDALFAVPLKYDRDAAFTRIVSKDRLDVPITQALMGNEIIMEYAPDYMEEPVLASTRYIQKLDWGIVVKVRESEVNDNVESANRYLVWLEVVIIVLASLVGVAVSFYIALPVEKLHQNTQQISKGNFDVEPINGGWKEAQDLSVAFKEMANNLKDLNNNLNRKVLERTQELDEANVQLQEIAIKDPLTGLYNRRYFDERLIQEFDRAKRYGTGLVIVMLDIDHFKDVNDTWGHSAGDDVLVKIATYLQHSIRDSDILGRVGGEEFGIIFPVLSSDSSVMAVLERMRLEVAELVCWVEDVKIQVTCSFGVAQLTEDITDAESLIKSADTALYEAKSQGRNRIILFQETGQS